MLINGSTVERQIFAWILPADCWIGRRLVVDRV